MIYVKCPELAFIIPGNTKIKVVSEGLKELCNVSLGCRIYQSEYFFKEKQLLNHNPRNSNQNIGLHVSYLCHTTFLLKKFFFL